MMDVTDRHCRFFLRQVNSRARLYTEMITTGALIHGNVPRHLEFSEEEHPVALQLGGSEPDELARCAKLGEQYGYDEINLNIGCPSERVQRGAFGACLMAEPALVADCVKAIRDAVALPVTLKHCIGIDIEDYAFVRDFRHRRPVPSCTRACHIERAPQGEPRSRSLKYLPAYRLNDFLLTPIITLSEVELHLARRRRHDRARTRIRGLSRTRAIRVRRSLRQCIRTRKAYQCSAMSRATCSAFTTACPRAGLAPHASDRSSFRRTIRAHPARARVSTRRQTWSVPDFDLKSIHVRQPQVQVHPGPRACQQGRVGDARRSRCGLSARRDLQVDRPSTRTSRRACPAPRISCSIPTASCSMRSRRRTW